MRLSSLFLLGVIHFSFASLASAQALPYDGRFLLGTDWVNNDGGFRHADQYDTCRIVLHMNCLWDALSKINLDAARRNRIWITGADLDPATKYYQGISALGQWRTAGRYWAAFDSLHNDYGAPIWHRSRTGRDVQAEIDGRPVWVRRAESSQGDRPDTLLSQLHGGLLPFFWARYERQLGESLHRYYVRIYGRLLEPVGNNDDPVLTVNANWLNDPIGYRWATWNGTAQTSDTFYASELGTSWTLTGPKELYVKNPPGAPDWYWRGSLGLYWTGKRNLEIYYVTISDSIGDRMVFEASHPYDAAIKAAANFYRQYQPKTLFRHFLVDEPFWGQIWANAYIDSVVGSVSSTLTTADLTNFDNLEDEGSDPWEIKLGIDHFKHMEEFFTWRAPILGSKHPGKSVPNPYEEGVSFRRYDALLNDQPLDSMAGLTDLIHYLTGPVWEARSRPGAYKNFWFTPQLAGQAEKAASGGWTWDRRPPTPEEFRCMTNLAVACGARGIFPYKYHTSGAGTSWETGVVAADYSHDSDWADLDGSGILEYVGWKSNFEEVASLYKKLEAQGPKLTQMRYTSEPTYIIITDEDDPAIARHYFLSRFEREASAPDPDPKARYFAVVNRDCWPVDYREHSGRRHFDLRFTGLDSGAWVLEDLATHEFFKTTNGIFEDVPFDPGQGRVFRLSPKEARWFGPTNVAYSLTVPAGVTLRVDATARVKVNAGVTIKAAPEGAIIVGRKAKFKFGRGAKLVRHRP